MSPAPSNARASEFLGAATLVVEVSASEAEADAEPLDFADARADEAEVPQPPETSHDGSNNNPPTVGETAMRFYEGQRWEFWGSCNFLDYRKAVEAARKITQETGEKFPPLPDNEVTDFRTELGKIRDKDGNPVGEYARLVLQELLANYIANVDDSADRPLVVLRDPETGNLRVDYYSFEPVTAHTFDIFADYLNRERPDLAEVKRTIGATGKAVGSGESGRGFAIFVTNTIARGIESIRPKGVGLRPGVHLMFIINPRPPEAEPHKAQRYDKDGAAALIAGPWADRIDPGPTNVEELDPTADLDALMRGLGAADEDF